MKQVFIPILTILALMLGVACTPDNGENNYHYEEVTGPYTPTGEITFRGKVCSGNTPLAGVVVSDGILCVATDEEGYFEIDSDLAKTKFVHVSVPAGYKARSNEYGIPQHYHLVTAAEKEANLCEHTFNLEKIVFDNPDRFTMFICADPQPRSSGAGWDNIAYHSLDCTEDMYRDMSELAAKITDRQVYGLTLGDVTHENMSLYTDYKKGVKRIKDASARGSYQVHTCIGNHDNDTSSKTDAEGRHSFEEHLGPVNYSFNIGKIHFICIDNLIMKLNADGILKSYDQGLTDDLWKWLQNDLRYVDRESTIMIASHSPMFRMQSNKDRWDTNATKHGYDYKNLLSKYKKVHAWAGHVHAGYWFIYPQGHDCENVEVHTLARSTGELWTNEYIAASQPRGYVVMEVDGEDVSWYLKPTAYQSGKFITKTPSQPAYKYRDWKLDSDKETLLIDGKKIDEKYQMKVYKPGEYENSYIYVDVFIWDSNWGFPYFDGMKMQKVPLDQSYGLAHKEIQDHYYKVGNKTKGDAGYAGTYFPSGYPHTLFRIYEPRLTGTGEVTITDRFGNKYSRTISW